MAIGKHSSKVKDRLLSGWWAQRVEYAPAAQVLRTTLYRDYVAEVGARRAYGLQAFSRALAARDLYPRKDADGVYVVAGVQLKGTVSVAEIVAGTIVAPNLQAGTMTEAERVAAIITTPKLRVTPIDIEPLDVDSAMADEADRRIARYAEINGGAMVLESTPPAGATPLVGPWPGDVFAHVSAGGQEFKVRYPGDAVAPSARDDGRWAFSSLMGGEINIGVVMMTPAAEAEVSAQVARELYEARRGQRREEGGKVSPYTHADDDALPPGELASMAAAMAYGASLPDIFAGWIRGRAPAPGRDLGGVHVLGIARVLWRRSFETFKAASPRAMLVKAGGLIIAAIETIDRAEARKAGRG